MVASLGFRRGTVLFISFNLMIRDLLLFWHLELNRNTPRPPGSVDTYQHLVEPPQRLI